MSTTPNMNMLLPTPSNTPGPTWADEVNAAFDVVDAHDHTSGNGAPVPTAGINIDDDFSLNQNALLESNYNGLVQQSSVLEPSVVDAVYDVGGDLYFNNGAGTPVQITSGNNVNVSATALVPAGVIWPYGGTAAPSGFLMADGSVVSRATYADLFLVFGTTYNTGGEAGTDFRLPNMNGRAPVGAGTYTDPTLGSVTRTLGTSAGEASHVLSIGELATHSHGGGDHTHIMFVDSVNNTGTLNSATQQVQRGLAIGNDVDYILQGNTDPATLGRTAGSGSIISSDGSSTAHNTMQPYLVLNYIIKY